MLRCRTVASGVVVCSDVVARLVSISHCCVPLTRYVSIVIPGMIYTNWLLDVALSGVYQLVADVCACLDSLEDDRQEIALDVPNGLVILRRRAAKGDIAGDSESDIDFDVVNSRADENQMKSDRMGARHVGRSSVDIT